MGHRGYEGDRVTIEQSIDELARYMSAPDPRFRDCTVELDWNEDGVAVVFCNRKGTAFAWMHPDDFRSLWDVVAGVRYLSGTIQL